MTSINTNLKALLAQEAMRNSNTKLSTAMERLSTGLRINSAKDDAAGLAISNRMTAQVRGFAMATKNSNDGISMAQTADGAYGQVTSMLQRMRELSVQAANGSMTKNDRESIQLEIDELKMEIQGVASKTNFNGINLLDGSAQNIKLQTGTNEGELMSIGFGSVQTKDIGSGAKPALTSVGGVDSIFSAFASGDLVINGVLVGASLATDDNLSTDTKAASAVAKAAAINRVSDLSGVTAKVNDTQVGGSGMSATTALGTAGAVTINGVATATFSVGTDLSINRVNVIKSINDISGTTGVRAEDSGSDEGGVRLIADDGRNLTLAFGDGKDSANTGLGASATHVGTYSLTSLDGSAVTINAAVGGNIAKTGLRYGTFETNAAQLVTKDRSINVVGTAPAAGNVGVLASNTLVINGVSINAARATSDSASYGTTASTKAASAIAIAAAINEKTSLHGVVAKAEANVGRSTLTGTAQYEAGTSGSIRLNGVLISVNTATRNNVLDAINAVQGQTGVIAEAHGDGIQLTAQDGRNIVIARNSSISMVNLGLGGVTVADSGATAGDVTAGAGVAIYSQVLLRSDQSFTVARGGDTTANFSALGFREGTFGGKDTGLKVAELNVSTQQGAGVALSALDGAINMVAAAQARSGAFQNRLESAINVLSEQSENAQAARSRILDTDYAQETTNMAKQLIVQQAATAMLAQANQQQQLVLALLQ